MTISLSTVRDYKFYIWDDKAKLYWRKDACGYTDTNETAGEYTLLEALNVSGHCGPEKRIKYIRIAKKPKS